MPGDNRLTTLPDTLGGLNRLGYLHVGGNPLGRLPAALGRWPDWSNSVRSRRG
ncbi:hypothetical protein [Streptomyces tubercidicus]|uniref:hypothetical protein n=1 Tax=Streptomyces tubercidicus TaxID=47759 RepID=UPI003F5AE927